MMPCPKAEVVAARLSELRAVHGECVGCRQCDAFDDIAGAAWSLAKEAHQLAQQVEDFADELTKQVYVPRWKRERETGLFIEE
jgi:hypothetical protein